MNFNALRPPRDISVEIRRRALTVETNAQKAKPQSIYSNIRLRPALPFERAASQLARLSAKPIHGQSFVIENSKVRTVLDKNRPPRVRASTQTHESSHPGHAPSTTS